MQFDEEFLQSLLYEEESVELDVKREQYRFVRATEYEKSELLKDIISFANAWRRSDAFIMIGVEDIKGGKNTIIGITEFFDDADIQQFVNSKTQRPIDFSYRNITLEGETIRLIHIPRQRRPFFLTKNYGNLAKGAVYVRRGTSTDIADPDEIAQMGSSFTQKAGFPELEVFFCDPEKRTRLAEIPAVSSLVLITPDKKSIPDYEEPRSDPWGLVTSFNSYTNSNYYRQLVSYTQTSKIFSPLFFAITNLSEITAHDVRLEIKILGKSKGVVAMDCYKFPKIPERATELRITRFADVVKGPLKYEVEVREIGAEWLAQAQIDKVQPKSTYWLSDPLYLGGLVSQDVELDIFAFADNLPEPHQQKLLVHIEAENRQVDLEGILSLEGERMKLDPKYRRFFEGKKKSGE